MKHFGLITILAFLLAGCQSPQPSTQTTAAKYGTPITSHSFGKALIRVGMTKEEVRAQVAIFKKAQMPPASLFETPDTWLLKHNVIVGQDFGSMARSFQIKFKSDKVSEIREAIR